MRQPDKSIFEQNYFKVINACNVHKYITNAPVFGYQIII